MNNTTVVNNNTYTNLMARENLLCAVWAVNLLRNESLAHFAALKHRTKLEDHEIDDWQRAADRMYIPYDELLGIHPQDDSFLDRKVWDLENTPPDKFPLLLHYHPLVIYRHQVLKQADVVLALFLLSNQFSKEQMARDFDYYDPLTTGDSSLSACIQSIVAADIGYEDKALEYLRYALLMDLADVGGNVKDGCHIASMGGTWMAMTYGLAGMRDHGGQISFDPKIPVENLRFHLTIRGQKLIVSINGDWMTYLLREGSGLSIWHRGKELRLKEGVPVTEKLSALDIAELNYG
ncbi:MAG: hypothetical protein KatS3mg105_2649 [Gemmatales bacterium]|nr:MAG: hypothetical protein KatS3mg105_2649 [Gemmatales bacterium]